MAKQFRTAAAFKTALETHLRRHATERGVPFSTVQLKFVIERLLARLFAGENPPWLLKGGFAMDLRFRPRARTTKDVDLSVSLITGGGDARSAGLRDRLQEALDVDLGDYLTFRLGTPKRELTNAPGGGAQFPCEAVLVGKTYAAFHIDVGVGDALIGTPERLVGEDLLEFVGVPPAAVLAIPKPQQFAEKVHAYTFPWVGRLNSRTKDLVDLVLLIERGAPAVAEIRAALVTTFTTRSTHPLPAALAPPPPSWKEDFVGMAAQAGISTTDYLEAFTLLERFWSTNALAG